MGDRCERFLKVKVDGIRAFKDNRATSRRVAEDSDGVIEDDTVVNVFGTGRAGVGDLFDRRRRCPKGVFERFNIFHLYNESFVNLETNEGKHQQRAIFV